MKQRTLILTVIFCALSLGARIFADDLNPGVNSGITDLPAARFLGASGLSLTLRGPVVTSSTLNGNTISAGTGTLTLGARTVVATGAGTLTVDGVAVGGSSVASITGFRYGNGASADTAATTAQAAALLSGGTGPLTLTGYTTGLATDATVVHLGGAENITGAKTFTGSTTLAASTAFVATGLAAKAPLPSPALTGTPTVPTASAGTNTTQAASTAYVVTALAGAINPASVGATAATRGPGGFTTLVAGSTTDSTQQVMVGTNGQLAAQQFSLNSLGLQINTTVFKMAQSFPLAWTSGSSYGNSIATQLNSTSAGVLSLDTTTAGNALGTFKLTFLIASGPVTTTGLIVTAATNGKRGTFTLVSGAATVSNTSVTANSVISVTLKTAFGTRAGLPDIVPNAGVGFTATGGGSDSSTYSYVVIE